MMLTTEDLLTNPRAFGLTTASPVQRAICRTFDGLPLGDLSAHPDVLAGLGGAAAIAALPLTQPLEGTLLGPIRGGKSLLTGVCGLRATQSCDVSHLGPGEIPRVSIVSLTVDLAAVVFGHLVGALSAKPLLRRLLVEEPKTDSVLIRHPSGRPIEVKVVAGSRAGGALVARWSAGVIFDEFTRMAGEDAAVSVEDEKRAVRGRLLPGAQILSIGSPWAAVGPAYDLHKARFGRPDGDHIVWHVTGPQMNPSWWTPERCANLQRTDPRAYASDVLAEFRAARGAAFDLGAIDRAMVPRVATSRGRRVLVLDPSSGRSDAWTWCIAGWAADAEGRFIELTNIGAVVGEFWEQTSGEDIVRHLADLALANDIREVHSDQREAYMLSSAFARHGLNFTSHAWTNANKVESVERLRRALKDGTIVVESNDAMRRELAAFEERFLPSGAVTFAGRGAHDDYVALAITSVLALAGNESAEMAVEKYAALSRVMHGLSPVTGRRVVSRRELKERADMRFQARCTRLPEDAAKFIAELEAKWEREDRGGA
jgi:hypothetical protein